MTGAFLVLAAVFTRSLERVGTMDPALAQSTYDFRAIQLVYEPVLTVDYTARPYKLAPGYCELPEVSEDSLVYVFRTRGGDSLNVVRALERLRDGRRVSPNGWIMDGVSTVRAIDARTVEVKLSRRIHYFPWLMAMGACAVSGPGGESTGNYELSSWRRNHEMVFSRRSSRKTPGCFDTVRYLVVDDVSTRWLMFLKGELDMLGEISRDNWDIVVGPDGKLDSKLAAQGISLYTMPTLEVAYLGFNMRDPVVGANRKLRQALNAAFDYPLWEKFCNGRILKSSGPVPLGVDGVLESPFKYSYDLEKAKRLMVEAGYPGGIDPKTGRRLVLTLTIGRPDQESREAGELTASFYDRIGVKLELQYMMWTAFIKAVDEGSVQMYRMAWVGDYPDAQNFLQLFYTPNASPGPNHSCYSNPEYDRLYEKALFAPGRQERNKYWRECQEILREDCPWVFTHGGKSASLVRKRVENYFPSDFPYGNEGLYLTGEQ